VRTAWLPFAVDGGAPPSSCYTTQNGTVLDLLTRLTWQQTLEPMDYTWSGAQQYCATLALNGGGWRLPTVQEMETLVDDRKVNQPTIDLGAFPGALGEPLWTSSLVAGAPTNAWIVHFGSGQANPSASTSTSYRARCVR